MNKIYEDADIYLEWEPSDIPWIKIFTHRPYKELTECPAALRRKLFETYEIVEKAMIDYFHPAKMNMASFGNYLPRVHIHVMARFENDSHFPEPMWGKQQRDSKPDLPSFEEFEALLRQRLES